MNFVITCKATITTSSPTCEVCLNVLEKVLQDVSYQDRVQVERSIDTFCQTAGGKDAKLCYSLSVIKKDVSQVISLGLPLDKVCEVSYTRR